MASNELLQSGKLTKEFYSSLKDGVFLSSNVSDEYACPIFAEVVAPGGQRDKQWQRIKDVRAVMGAERCRSRKLPKNRSETNEMKPTLCRELDK